MNLPKFSFTVLDTETTGFVPKVHKIIEFASVYVDEGAIQSEYEQLFSIDDEIPPHVQVLTRIRPDMLQKKPLLAETQDVIQKHIGKDTLIVGQNISFDIGMLKGENIDLSDHPWIDTSMLASLVFPELASYSLGYLSTVLQLNHEPVHRALGDVHATLELFSKIWERCCALPDSHLTVLKEIFAQSSSGYQMLAEALPKKGGNTIPWKSEQSSVFSLQSSVTNSNNTLKTESYELKAGSVTILEETLSPHTLENLIQNCTNDTSTTHWIAVKNLEANVRRITLPDGADILHPPFLLAEPEAIEKLLAQTVFTADEATLAVKLHWFSPRFRDDVALHGNEKDIWNGRLAASETSPIYLEQFTNPPSTLLLDHRQLLRFIADKEHPAHTSLAKNSAIIIDDASMLEDTATKAYGHFCMISGLRATAEHASITHFVDLLELWIEKVRGNTDLHFLQEHDFQRPETKGLREQLNVILERDDLPSRTREQLEHVHGVLHMPLKGNLVWIEEQRRGSAILRAAPEDVAHLLSMHLYKQHATTLLLPPKSGDLSEILPPEIPQQLVEQELETIPLSFPDTTLSDVLTSPYPGKTIALVGSKRVIEDLFVRYTESLEQQNITLICQGMSGGQGRMQAEFAAQKGTVVWLLTPWTYEGIELPPNTVDHLILDSLPFDHPSDIIIQARSEHFNDPFNGYMLPRLKCRLFRLLRTFCRHRTAQGDAQVFDKRLEQKRYGKEVKTYLEQFQHEEDGTKKGEQMRLL